MTSQGQSTRRSRADRPRPEGAGKRTQRDPEGSRPSGTDKIRKAKSILKTILREIEEEDQPPPLVSESSDGEVLNQPKLTKPKAKSAVRKPPGLAESDDSSSSEEKKTLLQSQCWLRVRERLHLSSPKVKMRI